MRTITDTMHHVVRRQTLEFTVPEQGGAHTLQEELRGIVHSRLAPALDDIFSSLAAADEVIRLDRVEVDLGELPSTHLEAEFVERSRQRLREVLSNRIAALRLPPGAGEGASILASQQSRTELVRVFLESGAVPWWAPGGTSLDVETVFRELLESAPGLVVGMLRDSPAPSVVTRIVKQMSRVTRESLRAALAPSGVAKMEQAIADWERLLSGEEGADNALPDANRGGRRLRAAVGLDNGRFVEWAVLGRLASCAKDDVTIDEICRSVVSRVAEETGSSETPVLALSRETASVVLPMGSEVRTWLENAMADTRVLDAEPGAWAGVHATHGRQQPFDGAASPSREEGTVPDRPGDRARPHVEPGEAAKGALHEDPERPSEGPEPGKSVRRVASATGLLKLPQGSAGATAGRSSNAGSMRGETGEAPQPAVWRHESPVEEEGQYIENAGLVLLWPYLTRFFKNAGLVEDKVFRSEAEQERAVLLLQHVASGEAEWPEPILLLNKILCGWPHDEPVARSLDVSKSEAIESRELLGSVIDNWKALKNTSVEGLRTSFLEREGHLLHADEGWKLKVARAGYDVLLDQLPWGVGFVLLPWMRQLLYVEW